MKTSTVILKKTFLAFLTAGVLAQFTASAQSAQANVSPVVYSNVALGKIATASSVDDAAHAANYAVDGNYDTRFTSSYDDNQWLSVDLGKSFLLSQVIITWERSYARDFDMLFSADGSFTDLYIDSIQIRKHVLANSNIAGIDTFIAKSGTIARYVRMKGIKRATGKGYGIWEMQVLGATAATGLFPVSVTGFTAATAAGNGIQLDWSTLTEFSNAGFTVERSTDAISFTSIAWVAARNGGTVVNRYSYADKQAVPGKNYYRLKQTWNDGRIGYSQVTYINVAANSTVNTYPVPVKDHLVVECKGMAGESINISMFNASGFPVYTRKITVQSGQQNIVISRTAAMIAGGYFLHVSGTGNQQYNQHIVLQ